MNKEILIDALKGELNLDKDKEKLQKDNLLNIAELKDILDKWEKDDDYGQMFILDVKDDDILEIISLIEDDEDKNKIKAGIFYIKKLLEINTMNGVTIPLSDEQISILREFIELIKRYINISEYKFGVISAKNKKAKNKLKGVLEKLNSDLYLNEDDIDSLRGLNVSLTYLDKIITFVNEYNLMIYSNNEKKEETKVRTIAEQTENDTRKVTGISADKDKIFVNNLLIDEKTDEVPLTDEKLKDLEALNDVKEKPDITEKEDGQEKPKEEEKIDEENKIVFDPFMAQSFDYEPKNGKKKDDNIGFTSNTVVDGITLIKSKLKEIGINYDELSSYNKGKILRNNDNEDIIGVIEYLKGKDYLSGVNIDTLCTVLTENNSKTIEAVINLLNKYYNIKDVLVSLINRFPGLFTKKGYSNLIKVIDILKKNESIKIDVIIKENPALFVIDSERLKGLIEVIEPFKVNLEKILTSSWILVADENDILKNIGVLSSYGIDAKNNIDDETFMVLINPNLPFMIDQFIEMGMTGYIFGEENQNLRKIKSLIIKRLFYAYKNNLNIWKNQKENVKYENIIRANYIILNDDEIKALISKYEKLELLEEGYRLALYSDTDVAKIKRRCEFVFGNKVISRLKVYSVLSCLLEAGISLNDALLYAITYNSILEDYEYEKVSAFVLNILGGE